MRSGLYAIADADACRRAGRPLEATARALLAARPALLQLRWKGAPGGPFLALVEALLPEARAAGVPLIVNDRVDVAALAGADGVHLGQDDLPVAEARALLPAGALVGLSTHDPAQVRAGVAARPDYLGFGPIFPTGSKALPDPVVGLEGLREAVALAGALPVVAIGGIGREALPSLREAGARTVALISELLGEADEDLAARAAGLERHFLEGSA
ncbi:MAG: thiamine phosphate synthase [Deltaproteobacteria bacterium]|nr:thiamine phosphate synthase [Deltaproteobacteria bacterium]